MDTLYTRDIVAWANNQAAFLRNGQFDKLDLVNLAEEIEDVGKSEKRELASRLAVLIAHLLKWKYQPERQSRSWVNTIKTQRKMVKSCLKNTPSLKATLSDDSFFDDAYDMGLSQAIKETSLEFPEKCPWTVNQILDDTFFPD